MRLANCAAALISGSLRPAAAAQPACRSQRVATQFLARQFIFGGRAERLGFVETVIAATFDRLARQQHLALGIHDFEFDAMHDLVFLHARRAADRQRHRIQRIAQHAQYRDLVRGVVMQVRTGALQRTPEFLADRTERIGHFDAQLLQDRRQYRLFTQVETAGGERHQHGEQNDAHLSWPRC